jgi:zinc-binding alcohol dehydrogenase/oxidoreductase
VTQLSTKPEHLKWTEAAALPLAGLTAWRALFTRANLNPDDRVLVTGIGAGTALFALQFAVAAGAQVWVTSSSEQKIARAVELGAQGGFLYTRPGWGKAAARSSGPFQVIVDSAGGSGFEELVDAAAPGGRIVFFGATAGNAPGLDLRKVYWRQLTLMGSTMGNPSDWAGMTGFVGRHRIKPVLAGIYPFARATEAFDLMEKGGQFGKIVVEIAAGA